MTTTTPPKKVSTSVLIIVLLAGAGLGISVGMLTQVTTGLFFVGMPLFLSGIVMMIVHLMSMVFNNEKSNIPKVVSMGLGAAFLSMVIVYALVPGPKDFGDQVIVKLESYKTEKGNYPDELGVLGIDTSAIDLTLFNYKASEDQKHFMLEVKKPSITGSYQRFYSEIGRWRDFEE